MHYKDHELPVWLCHLELLGSSLFMGSRDLWGGIFRALVHLQGFALHALSGWNPVEKHHFPARVLAGKTVCVCRNWGDFIGLESLLKYRFFLVSQPGQILSLDTQGGPSGSR